MKIRMVTALAAMLGLVTAGLVGLAAPASATTQTEPVCATWKMRGVTGAYPDLEFGGAPEGSSVSAGSATLVKAEGEDSEQPGVEFAARNLTVQAPEGDELIVSVDYATGDGASTAAGAIRLFGYEDQDANTVTDAPDYGPAVASAEEGRLVLIIPAGKKLGTLGMAYDASNTTRGTVTFSEMAIGDREVRFTTCPEPSATASPSTEPSATASPSTEPSTGPSATVSTSPVAGAPSLPVTGAGITTLAVVGTLVLAGGVGLVLMARRRRVTFES
ncbi:MAG TPA: LPXTG cell wall anchor domain-containing protein [Armatimonadota bacterium]|nr:LPXTG cell wall anchor domain-containing protein [Armatimonadota bacterium]